MKITRSDTDRLIIVDCPLWIALIAFPVSLFGLYHFFKSMVHGEGLSGDAIGGLLGFLIFLFGGIAFTKRTVFDFDLVQRQLTWKRRGLLGAKGGVVPFENIASVNVQIISARSGNALSYRVALRTAQGILPLTESYDEGSDQRCEAIRTAICQSLQKDSAAQMESDILELAMAGRKLDAVKLAARRYRLDQTQATQFVDDLLQ